MGRFCYEKFPEGAIVLKAKPLFAIWKPHEQITEEDIWMEFVVQDDHIAQLMLYDDCIWDTGQPLYDPDEEHCAGLLPGRWVALI
jgi:hypothetical protein